MNMKIIAIISDKNKKIDYSLFLFLLVKSPYINKYLKNILIYKYSGTYDKNGKISKL